MHSVPLNSTRADQPLVSVVMPVWNRERFVARAVESVLNQTFSDFELIIIDDGSTDRTPMILREISDPRVRIIHQKNTGEYAATNVGFSHVRGVYTTWIHSDDWWPEDSLECRVNALADHPYADFVHADIAKVEEDGTLREYISGVDRSAEEILREYCDQYVAALKAGRGITLMHFSTILVRTAIREKVGLMDAVLPHAGDFDWMLRLLELARGVYVPKLAYYYRRHPQTKSREDARRVDTVSIVERIIAAHRVE